MDGGKAARTARTNSRSHSQSRCCSFMKNGKCIRCQCVKRGLSCVDCWLPLSHLNRCENSFPVLTAQNQQNSLSNQSTIRSSEVPIVDNVRPVDPLENPSPPAAAVTGNAANEVVSTRGDFGDEIEQTKHFLSQPRNVLKRIPRLS